MAESLFEHQCRDKWARRIRERTSIDPTWDSDQHGLLVYRLPSGELQGHVPPSISREVPCAIVTPVNEDGSDLRRGDSFPNRVVPNRDDVTGTRIRMPATGTPRLLTRLPLQGRSQGNRPGLGVFATGAASTRVAVQVIPSGKGDSFSALSTADILAKQADDPECQKFKALSSLQRAL
jgi:hypothetical protein